MQFQLEHNGRIYAAPRLVASLYFRAPHPAAAAGVRDVLDRFVDTFQPKWIGGKGIDAGHQALYAPFDEKRFKRLRNRLDPTRAEKHLDEWFDVRDTEDESALANARLKYNARRPSLLHERTAVGALTLWLPLDAPDPLPWLRALPFTSGTVGTGLCSHGVPDPAGYARAVRAWAFAWPNLLLPNEPVQQLGEQVPDVAWMTLISEPILKRCALQKVAELDLPAETTVQSFGEHRHALVTGDRADLRGPPALRAVARALWPAFLVQSMGFGMGLDDDANIRWQLRWILPER